MNKLIQNPEKFFSYYWVLLKEYRKDTQYHYPIFDSDFDIYEPLFWSFKDLDI